MDLKYESLKNLSKSSYYSNYKKIISKYLNNYIKIQKLE